MFYGFTDIDLGGSGRQPNVASDESGRDAGARLLGVLPSPLHITQPFMHHLCACTVAILR